MKWTRGYRDGERGKKYVSRKGFLQSTYKNIKRNMLVLSKRENNVEKAKTSFVEYEYERI
jgi:hypothetical protein